MQINWTLVAGLAAFSLAAAANWDAGTAARDRRGSWRMLSAVHLLLLAEVIGGWRFGAVAAIGSAWPEIGRHTLQVGIALAMVLVAAAATIAIIRVARRTPILSLAGLAALAAALLFGAEMLSVRPVAAFLYRPAGPVMLIAWLWLAIGLTTVGGAVVAVRKSGASTMGEGIA